MMFLVSFVSDKCGVFSHYFTLHVVSLIQTRVGKYDGPKRPQWLLGADEPI